MSEPAWLMKWQAREALKNGRPEEAHKLLDKLLAAGNRRAWSLRSDVVRGYAERAGRLAAQNSLEAAWQDLSRVESLAPGDKVAVQLREKLVQGSLTEIRKLLDEGKALAALHEIGRLREHPIQSDELTILEVSAQDWAMAEDYAERGDFEQARAAIEKCRSRMPTPPASLERFAHSVDRREDRFRQASEKLQDSSEMPAREIARHADEALQAAPQNRDMQVVRSRARQSMTPETTVLRNEPTPTETNPAPLPAIPQSNSLPLKRFFLWIDGVGGFLVCLGNQVTLGQASVESGPIDIPLMADVSRFHASLKRDEENYILESNRELSLNDRPLEKAAVLQSGDRLLLNSSCAMDFSLPVPGCASARLDFPGTRRLPMAVDAVLLMADLLVLGAGDKVHIRMSDLEKPLKLFRQKDRLGVQWDGDFYVEGEKQTGRALLPSQGSVHSASFAFAIEPVRK